jgi:hypothetical protein
MAFHTYPAGRHIAASAGLLLLTAGHAAAAAPSTASCQVTSGPKLNPVIELYTSEGCSSCPPADQWFSKWRPSVDTAAAGQAPVLLAFHVHYWDRLGWPDRFASPQHTERQHLLAARNGLRYAYTPQLVFNGRDWRQWHTTAPGSRGAPLDNPPAARAQVRLQRLPDGQFTAHVTPAAAAAGAASSARWSAYWVATEDEHMSRVRAGENRGETLKHDFVVREVKTAPDSYTGAMSLQFKPQAAEAGHRQRISLVVHDAGGPSAGSAVWQALSLSCGS